MNNHLNIVGTEAVKDAMDDLFENAGGHAETHKFVNSFYHTDFEGEVRHTWLFDNVGTTRIFVEEHIDKGVWNIQSADQTPKEFWIHLYKLAVNIDPDVEIEVKFQDESYKPVGGFVVKKDYSGVPAWSIEEAYDLEHPKADTDSEDESYNEAREMFNEKKNAVIKSLVNYAHDTIWSSEGIKIELSVYNNTKVGKLKV